MEDLPTDAIPTPSESTTHSLFSTLFISIVSCLFSIGCCYFALFSISFRHGLINSANKIVEMQSEILKPIPSKHFLSSSSPIPCKTSTPIPDAKWANAIIFSLESQYRSQGVAQQYLESDEYVSFSEKHYAFYASQVMNMESSQISENIAQVYDPENYIIYGAPENIVFFNNYKGYFDKISDHDQSHEKTNENSLTSKKAAKKVLKTQYSFNQTIMPEKALLTEEVAYNPLEFGFTSVKRIVGIETIKRALISGSHPIPVAFQLPSQIYYKEIIKGININKSSGFTIYDNIENQHVPNTIEENYSNYSCPFNKSKECHKFILYPPSSILYNKNIGDPNYDKKFTSYGNPVVMAIVGYNDNFILYLNSTSFLKGGFILRSVFMKNEHSREYFMNEITSYQELKLCHDNSDPNNWPIATSLKCIEETANASLCGSIELECLNDLICNTSLKYTYFGENNFIQWGHDAHPRVVKFDFPFSFLSYVIQPNISSGLNTQRNQLCGYSFIPYKVVEDMCLNNQGPFSFDAVDMQVKWAQYSYYEKKSSEKRYQKLKESTYKIEALAKRLPYDEIEL